MFGTPRRRREKGIQIGPPPWWEIIPSKAVADFIQSLPVLLPSDTILYFEGTLDSQVADLLRRHQVNDPVPVQRGTLWPKLDIHHSLIADELLKGLVDQVKSGVVPYPSIHFHAYRGNSVLLQWHDAFHDDPLLVSNSITEDKVAHFCERIGSKYSFIEIGG